MQQTDDQDSDNKYISASLTSHEHHTKDEQSPPTNCHNRRSRLIATATQPPPHRPKGQVVDVPLNYDFYKPPPVVAFSRPRRPVPELVDKIWSSAARVYLRREKLPELKKLDVETKLDWDAIAAVDVMGQAFLKCPICLEDRAECPRINRCGHVFCLTCLLRFFMASYRPPAKGTFMEATARPCPICCEPIRKTDLRPVRFQRIVQDCVVNEESTFIFLRREKTDKARIRCPLTESLGWGPQTVTPFDRYVHISQDIIYHILIDDYRTLYAMSRLRLEFGEFQEVSKVIDEAMELICEAVDSYSLNISSFIDEAEAQFKNLSKTNNVKQALFELLRCRGEAYEFDAWRDCVEIASKDVCCSLPATEARGEDLERQGEEMSHAVDRELHNSKDYLFFQMWDGQLIFLHPIFARVLLHSSGADVGKIPIVLPDVQLLTGESCFMDVEVRSRFSFLSHLPLGTSFLIFEVNMMYLLRNWTKSFYNETLSRMIKRFKKDERRRMEREKRYSEFVKTKLEVKREDQQFQLAQFLINRSQLEKKTLDNTAENFPTLLGLPKADASTSVSSSSSSVRRPLFRDSLIKAGPNLEEEEFPDFSVGRNRTLLMPKPVRVAPADDEDLNWRTGKRLILPPKSSRGEQREVPSPPSEDRA